MDHEHDQKIRVVDRRRFAGDGEPVTEAPEPEAVRVAEETPHSHQGAEPLPPVDFPSFIVSLATQALVMLGEVPHPETGRVVVNLEAARQTIDILDMLRAKTEGNRTEDENRLILEVLSSLQMEYVKKVKRP